MIKKEAAAEGIEISKFYMIGDNPAGDVKGANEIGWESILLRYFVYKIWNIQGKQ
jgi:ribonucleotide monophosphatase NagD (HAD superfamily)